jgi:hypothetical protein
MTTKSKSKPTFSWTKCDKSLPKAVRNDCSAEVFILCEDGFQVAYYSYKENIWKQADTQCDCPSWGRIFCWMPMPKLPRFKYNKVLNKF